LTAGFAFSFVLELPFAVGILAPVLGLAFVLGELEPDRVLAAVGEDLSFINA
jgi:hypothetical protein